MTNSDKETKFYEDMLLDHLDESNVENTTVLTDYQFKFEGSEYSVDGTVMVDHNGYVDVKLSYAGIRSGEDFVEISPSAVEGIISKGFRSFDGSGYEGIIVSDGETYE